MNSRIPHNAFMMVSGWGLINLGLYGYHEIKLERIYKKIYRIENKVYNEGLEIEKERLSKLSYDLQVYKQLCRTYPLFQVLNGPPSMDFSLITQD